MPRVACFTIPGLFCWFWSNDHDPPHFQAKREGESELRALFLQDEPAMFELLWGAAPRRKVLHQLVAAVEAHRAELLAEWEANVNP